MTGSLQRMQSFLLTEVDLGSGASLTTWWKEPGFNGRGEAARDAAAPGCIIHSSLASSVLAVFLNPYWSSWMNLGNNTYSFSSSPCCSLPISVFQHIFYAVHGLKPVASMSWVF